MLEHLNRVNQTQKIKSVYSDAFKRYGKVLTDFNLDQLKLVISKTDVPEVGNRYVADDEKCFEAVSSNLRNALFGEMPIQVGYVNGNNSMMNALEYHKASEVNLAVTDLVLLLGAVQDIENNRYQSDLLEAFYVPENTIIEVYGTTLHFAPCKVKDEGFKCAVILPKGTNVNKVENKTITKESEMLFMTNKWLLAHPDHKVFIEQGAHVGIDGENIEIYYK